VKTPVTDLIKIIKFAIVVILILIAIYVFTLYDYDLGYAIPLLTSITAAYSYYKNPKIVTKEDLALAMCMCPLLIVLFSAPLGSAMCLERAATITINFLASFISLKYLFENI